MSTKDGDLTYFLKSNESLLRETLREFAEKSYESASLNEIIKRSSFNKGSFYYRFPEKKYLYFALIDDLYTNMRIVSSEDDFILDKPVSIKNAINILFENLYRIYCLNPHYLGLLCNIFLDTPEIQKEITKQCSKSFFDAFAKRFTKTIKHYDYDKTNKTYFLLKEIDFHYNEAIRLLPEHPDNNDFMKLAEDTSLWLEAIAGPLISAEILKSLHEENAKYVKTNEDNFQKDVVFIKQSEILGIIGENDLELGELAKDILSKDTKRTDFSIRGKIRENAFLLDTNQITEPMNGSQTVNLAIKTILKANSIHMEKKELAVYLEQFYLENISNCKLSALPPTETLFLNLFAILYKDPSMIIIQRLDQWMERYKIKRFLAILLKYRPKKCTIVLTMKNPSEIITSCEKIVFLKEGKIAQTADKMEILGDSSNKSIIISYIDNDKVSKKTFILDLNGKTQASEFIRDHQIVDTDIMYKPKEIDSTDC